MSTAFLLTIWLFSGIFAFIAMANDRSAYDGPIISGPLFFITSFVLVWRFFDAVSVLIN